MEVLTVIAAIVGILALVSLANRHEYVCGFCGFRTYDEVEWSGHQRQHETRHKDIYN